MRKKTTGFAGIATALVLLLLLAAFAVSCSTQAMVTTTHLTRVATGPSSTTSLSTTTTLPSTTTTAPLTTTTAAATTTTVGDLEGVTVYITKTGEKYHRGTCSSLSKSKIPVSLSSAVARGYEPCSVCDPPTL